MKIYIDGELPKECFDCPCFRDDIEMCCGLDDGTKDYHNFVEDKNCPLETTQSLKQQVREEAVEEIRKAIGKKSIHMYTDNAFTQYKEYGSQLAISWYDVNKILDQVKGENNED